MAALKTGFSNPNSKDYLGELYLADIGIPLSFTNNSAKPVPKFLDILLKVKK